MQSYVGLDLMDHPGVDHGGGERVRRCRLRLKMDTMWSVDVTHGTIAIRLTSITKDSRFTYQ